MAMQTTLSTSDSRSTRSVTLTTRDGRAILVRHIRAEDADRLVEFFWRLSSETRWRRFFVPLDNVDPDLVEKTARRMAAIDPTRELALVATTLEDGHEAIVAVARFASFHAGDDTAEASIVVRDDFHGQGIGLQLFDLLIQAAIARGLRHLVLYTQSDNYAILAMVRHLGLPYTSHVSEGLYEISLQLTD